MDLVFGKKRDNKLVLLPGKRVFRLNEEKGPLRLNENRAGVSGRRKIAITDLDNDGKLDLLLNSQNATFYKNIGKENGMTIFIDMGVLDERKLAGHTSSTAVIDFSGDGIPELLIGAEDGFLYHRDNPLININR